MDLLNNAREKLEQSLNTLNQAENYTNYINEVLARLDDGLEFTKKHYGELNALAMSQNKTLSGTEIYFFFMRFTHQFYNVMNIIHTLPNSGYYDKLMYLHEARQQRFDELKTDALSKGHQILNS